MNFPLDADVQCTDGPGGVSTTIIVDPTSETVTHIAVRDPERVHTEYLVPIDQIGETTVDSIQLKCSQAELKQMQQFIETEFVDMPTSYYSGDMAMGYGYTGPDIVVVEHELIPEGEIAIHRGMAVEATDGYIGTVEELVVDSASGQVSQLVLQKGHFRGETNVSLPITEIEKVEGYTIFLKLDKASIEVLPVVQVRRLYSKKELNELDIVLLIVTFDALDKADQACKNLKALSRAEDIEIRDMAVIVKETDDKVKIKEAEDVDAKQGALFGAITGGLIGLLGGPIGAVVGAAAGAATGGVAADRIDRGFSDTYLDKLQSSLQPGSSALVTMVEQNLVEKVTAALADLDGEVVEQKLTDDVISQFTNSDA
jgi:uncharacterized membrane protein/sporulation protein YlmC with PRC-barrel domain